MRAALVCLALIAFAADPAVGQERSAAPPVSAPMSPDLNRARQELSTVEREIARLRGRTNALGRLNQADLRRLEELMRRKSALEQQIAVEARALSDRQSDAAGGGAHS